MKLFIKNSYLFIIFFIILLSKNFIFSLFKPKCNVNYQNMYTLSLEKEIENINIIKKNNYKTYFTYGKVINNNIYKFKEEIKVSCDTTNIKKNDLIIKDDYLIGIVKNVYKDYIIGLLITSKDFIITGTINNEYTVIKNKDNLLMATLIPIDKKININDLVFVSSLTGFNEKILIGYVDKINYDPNKISNNYIIKFNNLNNLDYVVILSKDNI
ncbi:MAG: rod shape-determining protein MreC [bacterium]|nr:rod shape-determining protein MreC [bacterium]